MGTCLTEFEVRWFERKFVDDRAQNQTSDNLLRIRLVRGWCQGIACSQATDCLQTIRNRRRRRATTKGDELVKIGE